MFSNCKFSTLIDEVATVIPRKDRRIIFKTIITGLIISEGSKCISAIYRLFAIMMLSNKISRKKYYGFLQSGKLKLALVWKKLFTILGDDIQTSGRLLVALDDTTYGKTGKKIANCDTHYDHAAKLNSSKYLFGHCRVVLGIQKFIHGRWACLPVKQKVYRLKKSVDKKEFKTKIEIAGELINELYEQFSIPMLVVTDSWFGNKSLTKVLNSYKESMHILTRLRIDSALYDFPPESKAKKRGRKKIYGIRLPKLSKLAATLDKKEDYFFIYGKSRKCEYSEFLCMHKGFKTKVKVVLVHYKNGWFFPIVSTDCSLTAQQMIEYYSARWKIESGFKELKHELGALDNQARKRNSVENHFDLCCIAMTAAWIYTIKQEKAPVRKFKTARANSYAFADIRRKIKNEYYESFNFMDICSSKGKSLINYIRDIIFQCAG